MKSVNKTNRTKSKMVTGSAISSTAPLNNVLGKRSAQMPVRFANHETTQILGKRKNSAATNNAPKSTSFYHHDESVHVVRSTSCTVQKENPNTEKVLPQSQSSTEPPVPRKVLPSSQPSSTHHDTADQNNNRAFSSLLLNIQEKLQKKKMKVIITVQCVEKKYNPSHLV